ncbi:MAG: hypothetical protein MZV64_14815 [Ignavibacteriales bacterium]|nr:hypothetical protein [Ignavibacteriales bacterium]
MRNSSGRDSSAVETSSSRMLEKSVLRDRSDRWIRRGWSDRTPRHHCSRPCRGSFDERR